MDVAAASASDDTPLPVEERIITYVNVPIINGAAPVSRPHKRPILRSGLGGLTNAELTPAQRRDPKGAFLEVSLPLAVDAQQLLDKDRTLQTGESVYFDIGKRAGFGADAWMHSHHRKKGRRTFAYETLILAGEAMGTVLTPRGRALAQMQMSRRVMKMAEQKWQKDRAAKSRTILNAIPSLPAKLARAVAMELDMRDLVAEEEAEARQMRGGVKIDGYISVPMQHVSRSIHAGITPSAVMQAANNLTDPRTRRDLVAGMTRVYEGAEREQTREGARAAQYALTAAGFGKGARVAPMPDWRRKDIARRNWLASVRTALDARVATQARSATSSLQNEALASKLSGAYAQEAWREVSELEAAGAVDEITAA